MSRALHMFVVPAILLLGASYAGLLLDEERERLQIPRSAARMTLGGFEPIAANLLKLRANELMKSRRFAEAVVVGRLLTALQPRIPEGWDVFAWSLAWENADYASPAAQWELVRESIRLLRRGLEYNRDSETLLRTLGMVFLMRISKNPCLRAVAEAALEGPPEAWALAAFQDLYAVTSDTPSASFVYKSAFLLGERLEEAGKGPEALEAYLISEAAIRQVYESVEDPADAGLSPQRLEAVSARIRALKAP